MAHAAATTDNKNIWGGGNEPMNASYGKLMMWFFLVSDALSFSGFLTAYGFARFKHDSWPASATVFSDAYWPVPERVFTHIPFFHIDAPLIFVGIMTFILILSSVTMVLAVEAGHRMDKAAVQKWMLWTILGGIAFLSCQAWEWTIFIVGGSGREVVDLADGFKHVVTGANLIENEYGPQLFANFFFFITGFHGCHVLSGVFINILVFYNTSVGTYQKVGHYEMVEKVGLYWHFVDLVWVFVFTFFYLV